LFDISDQFSYTRQQTEEIAQLAARQAIEQFLCMNLDNKIEQGSKGDNMPSKYRETYYLNDKPQMIRGTSKKETDRKFAALLQQQDNTPTLNEFVKETYRKIFIKRLSPTTIANYNNYLDRYILPVLGSKHMGEITVMDIQNFYDWMANAKKHGCKKNLNKDTIKRVSGLLERLYRIAIEMELVVSCPVKKTLLVNEGEESSHHQALPNNDVENVKLNIRNLKDEQQKLYMGLLIYTGMRREEIVGLGWEHVHLEERYGKIERVVVYPDGKTAVVRNKTKTKKSTREFVIPEALAEIMIPLCKKTGYIIHGQDSFSPIPLSSLKRLYSKAFKELGIQGYDNHDWRATFGTQLKEAGITSAQVADLMGHADTRMVERTYAPTRHEGIMKHKNTINQLNKCSGSIALKAL